MTDDYTNLDLDTAEQIITDAAGTVLAEGMRYYKHGIRNMIVGELGASFQATLEKLLIKHVDPLAVKQDQRFDYVLRQLEAEFTQGAAWRDRHDGDMKELKDGVAVLQAGFLQIGEEISQLRMVTSEHTQDIGTLKTDVQTIKRDMREMKRRIGKIERIVQGAAEESGAAGASSDVLGQWEQNHPAPDLGDTRA